MPANYVPWKTPLQMKWFRVGKFKQRAALAAYPKLLAVPNIETGVCIGLVFAWMRRRLEQPAELPERRTAFLYELNTLINAHSDAKRFNNTPATSHSARIALTAPNLCQLNRQSQAYDTGKDGLATLVAHIDSTLPGYYIWEFTFLTGGATHTCAFYADGKGIDFFDPNSGEYRIGHDNKLHFLQMLFDHYQNYVGITGARRVLDIDDLYLVQLG